MIKQLSSGICYVGQTKMPFKKRFWHHKWKLDNNQHDNSLMQSSWNKYGKNDFVFNIIEVCDKNDNMNNLEIFYISKYNSYKNGFNMTTGGEGKKTCPMPDSAKAIVGRKNRIHNTGKKHSDETKKRMSESSPRRKLTKENKEKLINSRTGSKHTEESKEKMRLSHIGSNNKSSKINESQAFKIKRMLIDRVTMTEISKNLDISYSIIRSIAAQKVWIHVEVEGWDKFLLEYSKNKKRVLTDQEVLKIRDFLNKEYSIKEVSNIINVSTKVIRDVKNGNTYKYVK